VDEFPPLRKKYRKLRTVQDVRRMVADVLNAIEQGEWMDAASAKTMLYGAQVLRSCIELGDMERRVGELEKAASAGRPLRIVKR
jgi:hypothetical protein